MWISNDNELVVTSCHDRLTRDKMTYVYDSMTQTQWHDTMTYTSDREDGMEEDREGRGWGGGGKRWNVRLKI